MKHLSKLESGKTYNLSQIFSNDFIVAIPDLQRDYCWGLETYDNKGKQQGELVSGFLSSLKSKWLDALNASNGDTHTPMGLIYGYEWPKGTYQLCDGQQRITTFYLLAGELYRNGLVSTDIKDILLGILTSHQSETEIPEMPSTLVYSIRETTLYFLSDLVTHYFLASDCSLPFYNLEERSKEHLVLKHKGRPSWYFLEYDIDPTIQSMLGALYTIKKFLQEFFTDSESISSFAKAIATKFSFIYYDMGNRMRGEETFVVLNTTGEPLTSTENLKPLLIGNLSLDKKVQTEISNQWEEREDWFWKHRTSKELTSDSLSRDFYTWWMQIDGEKETVNLIKDYRLLSNLKDNIYNIHAFFLSLKDVIHWIYTSSTVHSVLKSISRWDDEQISCASETSILSWLREPSHHEIFLPLVAFYNKFGGHDLVSFLRRICKNYYIGKTTKGEDDPDNMRPYVRFRDIINLIHHSDKASQVLSASNWYNYDEQQKDVVFYGREDELIEFEIDDLIRFDLNVFWRTGASTTATLREIRERLHILHELAQGQLPSELKDDEAISMSNQYRLLKFILRWGAPTGRQRQVNWKQWGVWFNKDEYIHNLSSSYNDSSLWSILASENFKEALCNRLFKAIHKEINLEDLFTGIGLSKPEDIMRIWLIGKFIVNEFAFERPHLITSYGDYSLCVNKEVIKENLINKELPISIGNICLHHVTRNGPWLVGMYDYANSKCLDSPLFAGILEIDYKVFKEGNVEQHDINHITNLIIDLMRKYTFDNQQII